MTSWTFLFPINRRHQRLATSSFANLAIRGEQQVFPINRRHQRLATFRAGYIGVVLLVYFQSIGATKDWRPPNPCASQHEHLVRFQSIGGTKDWRPSFFVTLSPFFLFPINRRHQRLATAVLRSSAIFPKYRSFQSIGVAKDWRHQAQ